MPNLVVRRERRAPCGAPCSPPRAARAAARSTSSASPAAGWDQSRSRRALGAAGRPPSGTSPRRPLLRRLRRRRRLLEHRPPSRSPFAARLPATSPTTRRTQPRRGCRLLAAGAPRAPSGAAPIQPQRSYLDGSRLHARPPGGRSSLRPPDASLEPEDAPLHLQRAVRHLHHRPHADERAPRRGGAVRPQPRRAQRHRPLRRHEEAGAGRRRRRGEARRHAVREPPLARRAAHELADDVRPDRAPARDAAAARRGADGAAAREGAHLDGRRAREARGEPRRRRRHAPPAGRGLHHRPEEGSSSPCARRAVSACR